MIGLAWVECQMVTELQSVLTHSIASQWRNDTSTNRVYVEVWVRHAYVGEGRYLKLNLGQVELYVTDRLCWSFMAGKWFPLSFDEISASYFIGSALEQIWPLPEPASELRSGSQKNKSPWVVHTEHEHAISIVQIEYESYWDLSELLTRYYWLLLFFEYH